MSQHNRKATVSGPKNKETDDNPIFSKYLRDLNILKDFSHFDQLKCLRDEIDQVDDKEKQNFYKWYVEKFTGKKPRRVAENKLIEKYIEHRMLHIKKVKDDKIKTNNKSMISNYHMQPYNIDPGPEPLPLPLDNHTVLDPLILQSMQWKLSSEKNGPSSLTDPSNNTIGSASIAASPRVATRSQIGLSPHVTHFSGFVGTPNTNDNGLSHVLLSTPTFTSNPNYSRATRHKSSPIYAPNEFVSAPLSHTAVPPLNFLQRDEALYDIFSETPPVTSKKRTSTKNKKRDTNHIQDKKIDEADNSDSDKTTRNIKKSNKQSKKRNQQETKDLEKVKTKIKTKTKTKKEKEKEKKNDTNENENEDENEKNGIRESENKQKEEESITRKPKLFMPEQRLFYRTLVPHVNHIGRISYRVVSFTHFASQKNSKSTQAYAALNTPANISLLDLAAAVLLKSLQLTTTRKETLIHQNRQNPSYRSSTIVGTVPVSVLKKPTDHFVYAHCLARIYEQDYVCVRMQSTTCIYITFYHIEDVIRWALVPITDSVWLTSQIPIYDDIDWRVHEMAELPSI